MKTGKTEKITRVRRTTHLKKSVRVRRSTRLQKSARVRKPTHLQKSARARKPTHLQKSARARKPTLLEETTSVRRATLFEKTTSIGRATLFEETISVGRATSVRRATLFEKTTSIGRATLFEETTSIGRTERNTMDGHHITVITSIILLTLLSGFCDAQGFLHAANIWEGRKFIWSESIKSALGFSVGIGMYWICIRFLKEFKIVSPEIQTVGWFSTTMIGVAIFSGSFFQWQRLDQIVGIFVLLGIVWLLVRAAT